jgi:flagellar hook-associated protein 2
VGQARGAIKSRVEGFVNAYNAVIDQINELTAYDPETRAAGLMLGDSTVRSIRSQLSAGLSRAGAETGAMFTHMVNLGINSDENGRLSLNEAALERAMDRDLAGVVTVLNNVSGGIRDTVDNFTQRGGLLDIRTDGLQTGIRDIDRQRERLENRMEQMEARLVRQFGAMDALVGQLQQTSQQLEQQMSSLTQMLTQNRRR